MCVISTTKHGSITRVIACVFFSTNHTWIHQWSLHVCSFHKPHMDQPLVIACVFFPQTTHESTTRVIACVFFSTNHTWIHQWSLHVSYFHKPHMDLLLESLHVCSYTKTT